MKVDILYSGPVFHTGVNEQEAFKYLGITKGLISYLGNEKPTVKVRKHIVLNGKHAYPALTDSHIHLLYSIVQAASDGAICSIKGGEVTPSNMVGVKKVVEEIYSKTKEGQIVVATNYIISAIEEGRMPFREELDKWCKGAPVVIYNIDGHSSALSTAMLNKIGIKSEGHSGILTGADHEFNQGKITDVIATSITPRILAKGVANFTNECIRYGIGRVCALDGNPGEGKDMLLKLLVFIARRMEIGVRLYPQYINPDRAESYKRYMKKPRIGGCGEWEMDGSVGSHSAAMSAPFIDTSAEAKCYYEKEFVDQTVKKAAEAGYQIASHAIGDKAIDLIVSALVKNGGDGLHRIEHFEFPSEEAIELVESKGFGIVVQPGYAWIDKHYLHSYEQFLKKEVITQQLPLKRLYAAGIPLCGSSDCPVQSMDPYVQILGMMDFVNAEQSLTAFEAFRCYTKNPARILDEENKWGELEVGKQADFFITDSDIFNADIKDISEVKSKKLYLMGKKIREKKGTLMELVIMMMKIPHKI